MIGVFELAAYYERRKDVLQNFGIDYMLEVVLHGVGYSGSLHIHDLDFVYIREESKYKIYKNDLLALEFKDTDDDLKTAEQTFKSLVNDLLKMEL